MRFLLVKYWCLGNVLTYLNMLLSSVFTCSSRKKLVTSLLLAFKKEQEMISSVLSGASQEPLGEALSSSWTAAKSHRCTWDIEYSTFHWRGLENQWTKTSDAEKGKIMLYRGKKNPLTNAQWNHEDFSSRHAGSTYLWKQSKEQKKGLHIENKAEDSIALASRFCVLYPACYKRSNLPQKPYSRIENIQ